MRKNIEKAWKAAPLPSTFHAALEAGDWLRALQVYQRHPYHAPPVDCLDLLKAIMHHTGIRVEDVKGRFNEKIRLSAILQRKAPDEVEWATYWEALARGDSKGISAALSGAHISSAPQQVAVAEACAVLLKQAGPKWEEQLVDAMPFATVTRSNLVHAALSEQRWDVAVELLRHTRLTKADLTTLWPLMEQFQWEHVFSMISACPKSSVPYQRALTWILRKGCSLQELSERLEQARVLGDVEVVGPLLRYAVDVQDWAFVHRGIEHLVDLGQISSATHRAFEQLTKLHGTKQVCARLTEHKTDLLSLSIESLESLKL